MKSFILPRELYFGDDSLEKLKELKGERAIVVTGGSSMKRTGFLDKTVDYLKEAGMDVTTFEGVEPDPSVETVMAGAKAMKEFQPDWIVAIGGGSPIDAAKVMWAFYEDPEITFEEMATFERFPQLRNKAKFVAIPSTSGTASEVTYFAVITDYSKGIKYPIADPEMTPDIGILDPAITLSMPDWLTANTGMDALAHALETYVATEASGFSDPLAMQAIKMVLKNLPASVKGDPDARAEMHYAQCMAGQAFTNGQLGIVHSLAHKTGAAFEDNTIDHGYANAMYLPYVIQYNRKDERALRKYADIVRNLGYEGDDDLALTDILIDKIRELDKEFGIHTNLKDFGIPEEEFNAKKANIAKEAVGDACTLFNPRKIEPEAMEKLLECIYYGKDVDF